MYSKSIIADENMSKFTVNIMLMALESLQIQCQSIFNPVNVRDQKLKGQLVMLNS